MNFFPAFLDIKNKPCLVVGGGPVAMRKVELMQRAGGVVTVVAPRIDPRIRSLNPKPECLEAHFEVNHLEGKAMVISATSDRRLNEHISKEAMSRNLPVNVVDNTDLCSFIVPSVVDRDPIIVAVGSSGAAPVLARLTRTKIEALLPMALGSLGKLAMNYRQAVKGRFRTTTERRRFWERIFEGEVADKIYGGRDKEGEDELCSMLEDKTLDISSEGEVALVGSGPGDPELITFRAVRLLQRADVVVYDRLVPKGIVDLARRDAEKIYAGKASSNHTMPQQEINELLVRLAQSGKRVVRLKGGDPFIFGRGGEEIGELMKHNIAFQVVPGVTSASGCSSYAGIPLTHRDYAHSVVFATGHLKNDMVELNWDVLVQPNQTAVIYMGLMGLATIAKELVAHGQSKEMPVAVVHNGTLPDQEIVISDLGNIAAQVRQSTIKSPALIIVGEVVRLHGQLNWYGGRAVRQDDLALTRSET
jgi:uroporphyrin-III C-methyltransferase/precorrin-2 dehydrogenase/sirohydrochlorin ferrochelatase